MNTIAIIGGGASGMMAAIFAVRKGAKVLLLEQNDRLGKKILVTGNGRCNYTNTYQDASCYRSEQPDFITRVLDQFPAEKVITFFRELGIYPKDRNGYLYPFSDQASAVRDVLEQEVYRLGVDVRTGISCTGIQKTNERFSLQTSQGSLTVDQVILCNGSKAAPSTGSDGSGYALAKQLGHQIIPVLPALCALHCTGKHFRAIAGVRAQGKVSLFVNSELTAADTGELQLTAYGISGIPVFQISRYASKALYEQKEVIAMLNPMKQELLCVRGNCDTEVDQMVLEFPILADYCFLEIDGRTIFASHGHHHNPKNPPMLKKGDILLNGHTHIPANEDMGDFIYMNPGSVSIPKEGSAHGYMICESGEFTWKDLDGNIVGI